MSLNAEERASIIAKAMDRSFGELLVWKRPVLAHSFGENDLGQIDIFEAALEKTRVDVAFAYEQMSNDDLIQMDLELSDNFRISENNRAALSVKEIERLRRFVPLPIAYGFGHPAFAAKFEYWARMPRLSLHEVSLLSLGQGNRV